ncbi:nucleoside diphosphate kinase regulator [Azospirillum sp. BE72]|uniref:nucleoside diphosphate kinase regulator n=1 Tax=Azospirillum sp. BE72 TaxID=2817776 RepID=UPI00285D105D|nr:nucleoside diphosphate kinase regulator [Azospirillum sp. BE72]MDR6772143.1 regulator of nucleoside diphosphate kinase [Azospirillum sp. BE72]
MRPADQFPPIVLTATDHDRLSALVEAVSERLPDVYEYLTGELERAAVIDARELVTTVVTMGARVAFRDEVTGQERTVALVYPGDADLAAGRVSVLTPIGAALIGVAEGQSITWYTREGEAKTLTVLAVEPPIADGGAVAA